MLPVLFARLVDAHEHTRSLASASLAAVAHAITLDAIAPSLTVTIFYKNSLKKKQK